MLRDWWPWIALALLIAGVAAGSAAVVALAVAFAVVCGGAGAWANIALRRVRFARLIPEPRAFSGEPLHVALRVTNDKPLPLPWLDVRDRFPAALTTGKPEYPIAGQVNAVYADWRTSVGAHQRVTRTHNLLAPDRGVYELGPARLRSGDIFGLFSRDQHVERRSRIVVYPRTVDLGDMALPSRRPLGELAGGQRWYEDPSRISGVRDYRAGDSFRRIDWKATARRGELQSRTYEPSASRQLLLCLNTQTIVPAWAGYRPDVLERCITLAASIARDAYERRYTVGLIATGSVPDADRSIRIPPGRTPEQFIRMLEALGTITPYVLEPLSAMLDREEHRLGAGTTVTVLTGIMTAELAATLGRLRRRGHEVVVLSATGDAWEDDLRGVTVRDASWVDNPWQPAQ